MLTSKLEPVSCFTLGPSRRWHMCCHDDKREHLTPSSFYRIRIVFKASAHPGSGSGGHQVASLQPVIEQPVWILNLAFFQTISFHIIWISLTVLLIFCWQGLELFCSLKEDGFHEAGVTCFNGQTFKLLASFQIHQISELSLKTDTKMCKESAQKNPKLGFQNHVSWIISTWVLNLIFTTEASLLLLVFLSQPEEESSYGWVPATFTHSSLHTHTQNPRHSRCKHRCSHHFSTSSLSWVSFLHSNIH